jgi:hypothetical protein
VAQRVDELLFLYTNIRLRHQRNKTTVGRIVPSHLPTDYNGGLLVTAQNCSCCQTQSLFYDVCSNAGRIRKLKKEQSAPPTPQVETQAAKKPEIDDVQQ